MIRKQLLPAKIQSLVTTRWQTASVIWTFTGTFLGTTLIFGLVAFGLVYLVVGSLLPKLAGQLRLAIGAS